MDWQSIPVPRRMRALGRDRRGYPVPFIILRDTDGRPHYTINDTMRVRRCILEKRCQICGNRIDGLKWFVGGPQSALHEQGAYLDVWSDHECMTYALQVCPYLAKRNYDGRLDTATLDPDKIPNEHTIFKDYTMIPERPALFVAVGVKTAEWTQNPQHPEAVLLLPDRPYLGMEFWRLGERLPDAEGMKLAQEELAKALEKEKVNG